jgi:hypothetical protein
MFIALARQFEYKGPISLVIGQQLRAAISDIMGHAAGHGLQQWMINSEALSLEILRQASRIVGRPATYSFDLMAEANHNLRVLFVRKSAYHAQRLEDSLLPQILSNVDRHSASSPMELFTNLVSISPSMPPLPKLSRSSVSDTFAFAHLHPETAKLTDLANRITHIILLHWRVWGPIAYVVDDESHHSSVTSPTDASVASSPSPQSQPRPSLSNTDQETSVPTSMRTGETLDSGQDTHVAHQSLPQ